MFVGHGSYIYESSIRSVYISSLYFAWFDNLQNRSRWVQKFNPVHKIFWAVSFLLLQLENNQKMSNSYFSKDTPDIVLRSLFTKYDRDNSGTIAVSELPQLFVEDLGLSSEEAETYTLLVDKDGSGTFSFDVSWTSLKYSKMYVVKIPNAHSGGVVGLIIIGMLVFFSNYLVSLMTHVPLKSIEPIKS